MKKIVLFCAGGLSTGVLVNNMKKEAVSRGFECSIDAFPIDSLKKEGLDADVILLGPQVSYRIDEVKAEVSCPVEDIDLMTYGMMDGKKALERSIELMGL